MKLSLGFSTCPNDTFMFDAMVHGRIDTQDIEFEVTMADILHLNQKAMRGDLDVVKVSYNTYGHLRNNYHLLNAGSAMGQGCGPLLIASKPMTIEDLLNKSGSLIAIPGVHTTANLLLDYFAPGLKNRKEMLFHDVMPAVKSGKADAGVIIHENRFTYQDMGLYCVQDLGAFWEEKTGLPIPLGAICARKSLGEKTIAKLEGIMRDSVAYAFANPAASTEFIREHAQELDEEVTQAHIALYVNDYSLNMGEEGHKAVEKLLSVGESMGLYS